VVQNRCPWFEGGIYFGFLLTSESGGTNDLKEGGWIILFLDGLQLEAEINLLASGYLDDVPCHHLTWATSIVARSWQRLCEALEAFPGIGPERGPCLRTRAHVLCGELGVIAGPLSTLVGDWASARTHLDQAIAHYHPREHRNHVFLYGAP
jgi:hypothetical protein